MENIMRSNSSESEGNKPLFTKIKIYRTANLFQEEIDEIVRNILHKEKSTNA